MTSEQSDAELQSVPVHNQQLTRSIVLGGFHQLLRPFAVAGPFPGI